jgi:hypothetical protein
LGGTEQIFGLFSCSLNLYKDFFFLEMMDVMEIGRTSSTNTNQIYTKHYFASKKK